jgi:non-ribosomal peptide synthetase component E (peptide arylation enzyme)
MDSSNTLTLGDISREHRFTHANRLAVVDGDVRLTYDETRHPCDQVGGCARALDQRSRCRRWIQMAGARCNM